jgi:hypothetical protein
LWSKSDQEASYYLNTFLVSVVIHAVAAKKKRLKHQSGAPVCFHN